ncbi:hypothetical protein [uncultured Jatrophihabitans sp.]|uniref:hypothetical protein n=1 Tax=uncultured Jatrophihabitans sp. TaxID=1610747 RepID=UPI0035C980CE
MTLSTATSYPYQSVTATATVAPSAATGTVTFTRSGTTLCLGKAVVAGTVTCSFAPQVVGSGAVTATYTPTSALAFSASNSTDNPTLTVAKYPVTVKAAYDDNGSSSCAQRVVTVTVTRGSVSGGTPSSLPALTGTVSVDGAAGITLPAGGTVTACTALTTSAPVVTYSGDARDVAARVTAAKAVTQGGSGANHTRTGSGGGTLVGSAPAHTRTGSGPDSSTLADTGTRHVAALLLTALGLLVAGAGCLTAGRRRTRSL